MSYNRSYGNTSRVECTNRSRYGHTENPISNTISEVIAPDCVSCTKHMTGKIPYKRICHAICKPQ